jgi:dihydrofolate synthase/folylpolyglutamate synthase
VTYRVFLRNLNARGMFRIRPGLGPVRKVLRILGNPQDEIPTIHIAGTNGKGSVAAALESVLTACGYRTGLYTSPHLIDLRERIRIAGLPFIHGLMPIVEDVLRAERRAKTSLTYFELLTAIAFQTFAAKKMEIAIIECGLGGLWDATNVIKTPHLSIITSVGLDHTEWLGKKEEKIAAQKAGIIKSFGRVVSGVRGPGRLAIAQKANESRAELIQIDRDFKAHPLTASWRTGKQTISFQLNGGPPQIAPFGLLGVHQVDNAAIVMAALGELQKMGWEIAPEKRDGALREVNWPGRLQLLRFPKIAPILLDGAHNVPAMKQLRASIETSVFKSVPKTFVFSAYKDKDWMAMGQILTPLASEVCLCSLPGPRGVRPDQLRKGFHGVRGPIREFNTAKEALSAAIQDTPQDGLVIVTGSLTLVGQILSLKSSLQIGSPIHV